jgi:MFS family permease
MTQLSGIDFITYYAPNLYESIGMTRHTSTLVGGFQALEYFLVGWIPVFLIERIGRRKMMIGGTPGCCVMMTLAAIMIHNGGKAASIVAVVCIYGFNPCFAFAWLTVPWLYGTEVTTLRIRAKGASKLWVQNVGDVKRRE